MRPLLTLIACCCVLATASAANDPLISPSTKSAVGGATGSIASIRPNSPGSSSASASSGSSPTRKMSEREREAEAESDLSAKIAARLAIMRANQQARAAAAAKAKKVAAAAPVVPRVYSNVWSYEGENGPANWGKINPEWAKCGTGNRQSPIDIRDGMKVELEQIAFDYHPSSFNVTDNGHTVQVMLGGGNFITVNNRMYELIQFHFHRPSEERINGKGYEMVVHLVHKDGEGKLAVLALLLERGKPQPVIQTVWNNLPLEKLETLAPSTVLDPMDLLPARRDYFTFMGSLTTPPCSEGVLWLVMKEPVQASPAQMALFSRLYPLNARPIQPGSGRIVKESN
ncbi:MULTISPECIES: carbonic anhydrase [unclassified Duganella]|uniref:carbonic anhydrase n=1 Tax=unclassified Duganella TaxID=2636909 RepID=UPI000E34E7EC|nr:MULTISPECIES: carbonic anhydrase family protein [unclassified Duganella]RFP11967.1 carbonic anhydrase family protein [Duganella sp. BJB475]RFP30023.1 carbonic anhydrase family protein [Duganella sp. BJB476]